MPLFSHSLALMVNLFSMMVLTITLSLFGKSELAAEVALIHSVGVALFYSFSGNARSLILSGESSSWGARILRLRLLLLIPLCVLGWLAGGGGVQVGGLFIGLLILRRGAEWLAEVFLSEQERQGSIDGCVRFIVVQCVTLVMVSIAMIADVAVIFAVSIWACSPLLVCVDGKLFRQASVYDGGFSHSLRTLLPHFGSTLAIGVSVYVFRLFIILLVGKQQAGDLFAAFALGGIMGAVFSQALGPTMIRNQQALVNGRFIRFFNLLLLVMMMSGVVLAGALWLTPDLLTWTAKAPFFWMAVSCSLVGGGVMVMAQRVRLQLLHNRAGRDVFGSDVLANLLLVGCVPLVFFIMGEAYLVGLYLVGAALSLAFYMSEDWGAVIGSLGKGRLARCIVRKETKRWFMSLLVVGVFLPVFFQLDGGIYQGSVYEDSGGKLLSLPLPISMIFCCIGIVLIGRYARARNVLMVVFFTFSGMWMSVLLLAEHLDSNVQLGKLFLLVQYVFPMLALIAGVQFGSLNGAREVLARGVLVVLLVVASLQVLATLVLAERILSQSVFLFSVYQSLQYVPVIFVGGYLISLYSLWREPVMHIWLLVLAGVMGMYAVLSHSMLALLLLPAGALVFVVVNLYAGAHRVRIMLFTVLLVAGMGVGFAYVSESLLFTTKFNRPVDAMARVDVPVQPDSNVKVLTERPAPVVESVQPLVATPAVQTYSGDVLETSVLPPNLRERMKYWRFYFDGVQESWHAFLLGHEHPPERSAFPSAHNYYLDFVYNFGFLALLPLLGLMLHTLHGVWKNRTSLLQEPGMLAVAGVLCFVLLVDSSFKVGMRQPYPGVVTFFWWGMLLAWLWRVQGTSPAVVARSESVRPLGRPGRTC